MKNNKRRTPQLRKRTRLPQHEEATLAGVIDISRVLSSNLDIDTIWDALHDHINLTFDTTSFFIGLYDYERDRLLLPLVSEEGLRVEHEAIPVCGVSRAVILRGSEFYSPDLDDDEERLRALGAEPDEREPGRWARAWIGVPLHSRQSEITGLIALQNSAPASFDDHDLALLLALAAPLSLLLDNLRLTDTERERRLIAGALMEIGQTTGALTDYDDVLERLLDQLQRVVGYDTAAILLPANAAERLLIVSASHDAQSFDKGSSLSYRAASPLAQSVASQQPIIASEDFIDWWEGEYPEILPMQTWLIVPMTVQQRVCGLILLGKTHLAGYTQKDASSAFALARQGAIAMETTRLQAQSQLNLQVLQQRARRLGSINRITSVITSSLNRDEVFRTTAQLLTELFEADHCGIVMMVDKSDEAVLAAEYPATAHIGLPIRMTGNSTMDMLTHYGTAVAIEDIEDSSVDDATRDALRAIGAQSTLIAPLIVRDRVIGTIGIDMLVSRRHFTGEECETLVTIAGQVAMAVAHANLYEEALAVNRLRSAFLANISHELRTPLNAIIGYSEMLLSEFYGALNEQQHDRVARVNTSGKHLLNMIDDVLDLSKLEAGQITLAPQSVRMSHLLEEALVTLRPQAEEKALSLEVKISPDEPLVRADPRYLNQMIMNLLKNAVKFTLRGGIRIEVLPAVFSGGSSRQIKPPMRIYVPEGDWIALRVSDSGIGIRVEDQEIIFESFRQVDSSPMREYGGPGLGLAITRRLVEMHEGYIWVDSELGVGSTFNILLPTVKLGLVDDIDLATVQRDARPLILVIDDGPADRQLLQDYLGGSDYQVVCTANPVAAQALVRVLQPDVVITDVMMPEVTGWEVLRGLKADEETARIPVIVISILDQKQMGFGLGAADYLVKPVDRETLRTQVQRVIDEAKI